MIGFGVLAASAVYSAFSQSRAAKKAAEAARLQGVLTKKAYDTAAAETLQAGEYDAFMARLKGADVRAKARAAQGASNLEGGEDALGQIDLFTAMDTETIRMNARRAAWGLKEQGRLALVGADAEAARLRRQGNAAALGSLIDAAGQAAVMYSAGVGGMRIPGGGVPSGGGVGRLPMGSALV